jgi:hypothetical protein
MLLVTINVVPSELILSTLIMETIPSSETPALARATRHHIPEDGIVIVIDVKTTNLTQH